MSADQSVTATFATNGTGTAIAAGYEHTCAVVSTGHVECWAATYSAGSQRHHDQLRHAGRNFGHHRGHPVDRRQPPPLRAAVHRPRRLLGLQRIRPAGNGTTTAQTRRSKCRAYRRHPGGRRLVPHLRAAVHRPRRMLGQQQQRSARQRQRHQLRHAGRVSGVTDAAQVTAGYVHTCALLSTGHVDCWGYNGYGELATAPKRNQTRRSKCRASPTPPR